MSKFTSRRLYILFSLLWLNFVNAGDRPNILVLYADDWRFDTLGCAGNPLVKTPNLDALAKDGLRFSHNYVTTSICGVSRATLFTGQWMSRHGNFKFDKPQTPWAETYPALVRANGYWSGHIGKWHTGEFPAKEFDFARSYSGNHWIKDKNNSLIHVTKQNEKDAIEFLSSRPKDRPFSLNLSFFATHAEDKHPLQFLPQPESFSLYHDVKIPRPKTATDAAWKKLPSFFNDQNEGRMRWISRFNGEGKYQEMMKNYYRLVSEVDETCGKIIDELKRQGLYDKTLIIFTTDNGYFHGEHGLADKWYPYQESIRVPLIIRDPRMQENLRGKTRDEITLNVDLAPTILHAAGIKPPSTMQGSDLSSLYTSKDMIEWRTEFFYEHPVINNKDFIPASEALVRKDWKYFYWPDYGVEQLFHIANDPHEEVDLSSNEANKNVLDEMRARFVLLKKQAK